KRLIAEYNRRLCSCLIEREAEDMEPAYPIEIVEGDHCKEAFFAAIKGLETCGEGSERCFACFRLRLEETARRAKEAGADYFATTLTISPLKNAAKLNEIGEEMAEKYGVTHLPSDFKKKNGYKRSVELSEEYGLYRQDYCGCIFSKMESEERKTSRSVIQ
ncbi:MAG: epoxyqueuosine reductase QueH, partial [Lachnospiraceae bacterium]|nr:epoxyqueuosine reductase QueH [Lachnospiraceae bacterium]